MPRPAGAARLLARGPDKVPFDVKMVDLLDDCGWLTW